MSRKLYTTGKCAKNCKNKYGCFQGNKKCSFTGTFCRHNPWQRICFYEPHTSKNLDYTYWLYNEFDLENWTDAERRSELRFLKGDVYRLFEVFDIPEESNCYYRSNFNELERFCVFLKRLLIFVAILIWCQVSEDQCLKHVWCQTVLWICCMKIFIIFYIALISHC